MSRFEWWLLRRIVKKAVRQGPTHRAYITKIYKIVWDEARIEFCEDTGPTLRNFLAECYYPPADFYPDFPLPHPTGVTK